MTFKDLRIGQEFDFVDDEHPATNSFHTRCRKVSPRGYVTVGESKVLAGSLLQVGSVKAKVYHVS